MSLFSIHDCRKTRQIEKLQHENSMKDDKIQEITLKLDIFEQTQYDNDVQLVGLPESKDKENDLKKVLKLVHTTVGHKIKEDEIVEIIRLGRKSEEKARDTIVKFKTKKIRETLYSNRKKSASNKKIEQNVYINDRLTSYRKGLFYAARQLYKRKKIAAAWTQHGNILVRKELEDAP